MQKLLATLIFGAFYLLNCSGQDYSVHLKSAMVVPLPGNHLTLETEATTFSGYQYVLVQFYKSPTVEEREKLKASGIQLLDYVPHLTWLVRASVGANFQRSNIRAVLPLKPEDKIDQNLLSGNIPMESYRAEGILVRAFPFPGIPVTELAAVLSKANFQVIKSEDHYVKVIVPPPVLLQLAAHPALMFVEGIEDSPIPEGWKARSLMRVNQLQGELGTGYDGRDVNLAIADDGTVSHEDFRNRLIDYTTGNAGNHGDMTAGIAIGAGNIDPLGRGIASGATLHLFDITQYQHILNAEEQYASDGIVITSTSYGEGCGAFYNYSAQSIDQQVMEEPVLFHCFSAGNSGLSSCNLVYGGLEGPGGVHYGNITGGRKAAKNTIAVGNLYFDDELRATSSRGPTEDGRIKPDLCAQGQGNLSTNTNNSYQLGGGTSAASPTVAGIAALLYQAYREYHDGVDPMSGLIKAILLNTAEDLGRPGPDYDYGWGRANASRALDVIENGQYTQGSVSTGSQDYHVITVPANTAEVRVMVYWTDPAPSILGDRALVNDLDINLQSGSGQNFHPLVLSNAPNLDSLLKPAYRGIDRVNNMEEVVLTNPNPGNYTLRVKGHLVPEGPQQYYVVYSFISNDLKVTYPSKGVGMVPGETNLIRWDAPDNTGNFSIQYSLDSMATWHNLANSVAGHLRHFEWYVPFSASGKVFVRVNRAGVTAHSEMFTIIGQPNPEFYYVNDQAARMEWEPIAGATHYEIFALGEQYMEVIGTTTESHFIFPIELWESNWFSIRACIDPGKGRRVYAQEYLHRPCQVQVNLDLQFDLYPSETSWQILTDEGEIISAGGPYNNLSGGASLIEQICLPYGCYELILQDEYGDGMCCTNGNGQYVLRDGDGQVLASGGQFPAQVIHDFCLAPGTNDLMVEVISTTAPSCTGSHDGAARVAASNGSGNYTYTWSSGAIGPQANNLGAGLHRVTVTDGEAQLVTTIQLYDPNPLSIELDVNQPFCNSSGTTIISSEVGGGTPPYSYLWNTGVDGSDLETQSPGAYTLSVTDAHGCTASQATTVEQSDPLGLNTAQIDASCHGALNGVGIVAPSGGVAPYNYQWSTGGTGPAVFGLSAGAYTVTVEDNVGCISTAEILIEQPDPLLLESTTQQPSCAGDMDGSVEMTATGGTSPYSYVWSNGETGALIEGLAEGNYQVTVTDGHGCLHTYAGWLPGATPLQLQFSINDNNVNPLVMGGNPPYTYQWSNGATSANVVGLASGEYQLTVTDQNDCDIVGGVTIESMAGYCDLRGSNTAFEWIESVTIGQQTHISGNNGGLGLFWDYHFTVMSNENYNLYIQPHFNGTPFGEYWRVWVDWNQDGDFSDAGEVVVTEGPTGSAISTNLHIPSDAVLGTTRIRIAMKYGNLPPDCGIYGYGETEEYSIEIFPETDPLIDLAQGRASGTVGNNLQDEGMLFAYPNPADQRVQLRLPKGKTNTVSRLEVMDAKGQIILAKTIDARDRDAALSLTTERWPVGLYEVRLIDDQEVHSVKLVIQR